MSDRTRFCTCGQDQETVLFAQGFEITIDHPHTDVVKCSQLVRASKDLAQTSYFMATNSLHLTTFCLQHRPTVIACVCIHLACKWSNWEIPVSTDGKHWWEYVDCSVTLELLDELTHEFLQILEKTPSKLKRIRNWRATQAAKKPKADGPSSESSSFSGPSLAQDQSMLDAISGISVNATFSKPSTSFSISLPGSGLQLDHIASAVQGASYTFTAPGDWPQDQTHSDSYLLKQVPLHLHRPDKSAEFTTVKHEHKANKSSVYPPQPTPQPQKMSLEKYKEKHAAELAAQKRRQEQPVTESEARDSYGSSSQVEHRKPQQSYTHGQQGSTSSSTSTSSPLKMKLPLTGQEKVLGDKREKGSSLKLRLPVQAEKSGPSKEELKMKIKVSSERHSSSDEGASKSKHSSPLVSKEKHRHHHKHGHSNPHSHSGSGSALKSPMTLGSDGAGTAQGSSSSSRKRTQTDGSHNHHSKKSKSSKSAAGGGLRPSQHAGESGQGVGGEPWS